MGAVHHRCRRELGRFTSNLTLFSPDPKAPRCIPPAFFPLGLTPLHHWGSNGPINHEVYRALGVGCPFFILFAWTYKYVCDPLQLCCNRTSGIFSFSAAGSFRQSWASLADFPRTKPTGRCLNILIKMVTLRAIAITSLGVLLSAIPGTLANPDGLVEDSQIDKCALVLCQAGTVCKIIDGGPACVEVVIPGGTPCGRNVCGRGLVCCNRSCGTCTKPGDSCLDVMCPSVEKRQDLPGTIQCGTRRCAPNQRCCDPVCGRCALPFEVCRPRLCHAGDVGRGESNEDAE